MKKINPPLHQIKRTLLKTRENHQVLKLLSLLQSGVTAFLKEPVYLVQNKDPFSTKKELSYLIYDGNTRHFLAENKHISLDNIYLLETDVDLENVRRKMKEIYWPGENLEEVIRYLRTEREYLAKKKVA